MVTAGIFPFKENSHGRAGNRTRDLMISSQRLWTLDHEAGHNKKIEVVYLETQHHANSLYMHVNLRKKKYTESAFGIGSRRRMKIADVSVRTAVVSFRINLLKPTGCMHQQV